MDQYQTQIWLACRYQKMFGITNDLSVKIPMLKMQKPGRMQKPDNKIVIFAVNQITNYTRKPQEKNKIK
jgi:hypothetical protein